jgi:LacI family transcriptional regulator
MKNIPGRQTATLKDIAQKTGYSVNTVSRALRDKDDVAPDTRQKIKRIAAQIGYVGNMQAAALRRGYTNTIAVILGDVSNPHFAIMMKEIETRAREYGYSSFLLNSNEDDDLELEAIQLAVSKNVDGIILCPAQKSARNVEYLKSIGIPFVLIGRRFQHIRTDYVICNDELGGYQATRYLLEQGHRRILMLNGPGYISSARERLEGYLRAYREAGVPADSSLICEIPIVTDPAYRPLEKLNLEQKSFTAVFAFSDILGWEIWKYLLQHGKSVPADCSVVGFDHIQSRIDLPFSLTSIRSFKRRMSNAAVDLLVARMKGMPAEGPVVIDTQLALGDTVAALSQKQVS